MNIRYYVGRFTEEQFLFDKNTNTIPSRGDFISFNDEIYKVRYTMYDYQFNEINVFLKVADEEDF